MLAAQGKCSQRRQKIGGKNAQQADIGERQRERERRGGRSREFKREMGRNRQDLLEGQAQHRSANSSRARHVRFNIHQNAHTSSCWAQLRNCCLWLAPVAESPQSSQSQEVPSTLRKKKGRYRHMHLHIRTHTHSNEVMLEDGWNCSSQKCGLETVELASRA